METEIIENLYIGNIYNSSMFDPDGYVITVLEYRDSATLAKHNVTWIPIMKYVPTGTEGVNIPVAQKDKLDAVAEAIEGILSAGKKVLVHCVAGMERSPLAVVWFLHKKRGMTIDEAYALVIDKRPIVQVRTEWIEK